MSGCVLIAILISAPQMLPTQELSANSHRVREATEEGYRAFIDNALPTYRLVTAFAPRFFGDPSQNNYYLLGRVGDSTHVGSAADYMEYGMYAGILPLMLALIALASIRRKHVGFFVVLTALALLTATGTPINRLFYFAVPGFSSLGGPNRILLLYLFGIAALAGLGADYMAEHYGDRVFLWGRPIGHLGTQVAWLGVLGAAGVTAWIHWLYVNYPPPPSIHLAYGATLFVLLFFSAIVLALTGLSQRTYSSVIVLVIFADLFAFGINYNPTCPRSEVYPKTKLTTELQRLTRNGDRIAPINPDWSLFETPKAVLPPNAAMVYGLYDVQGYDSLFTRAYQTRLANIEGIDPSPPENGNMVLVRQYTPALSQLAHYAISREPNRCPWGKASV